MKFSPSGDVVASGSFDKHIFLWNTYGDCENFMMLKGRKSIFSSFQAGFPYFKHMQMLLQEWQLMVLVQPDKQLLRRPLRSQQRSGGAPLDQRRGAHHFSVIGQVGAGVGCRHWRAGDQTCPHEVQLCCCASPRA
jgi:hypothetical protein